MGDQELLSLWVPGKCEPQGSARAFVPTTRNGQPLRRHDGSIVVNITSDNPALKGWRAKVAAAAKAAWEGPPLGDVSLMVEADFYLRRPQGHWGTGRNAHLLRDWAPAAPLTVPDADKLLRATLDALTGIVYADDSRVTAAPNDKHYAVPTSRSDGEGLRLRVFRRELQTAVDLPWDERVRYVAGAGDAEDSPQLALNA